MAVAMRARTERAAAWALLIAAGVWLVPANILPIMTLHGVGGERTATIAGGVVRLFKSGMPGIALIVFVASLLVPFLKVAVLAVIYWQTPDNPSPLTATRAWRLVYWIGRWSMLDVFVVALLTGLMQFGQLAYVKPQPGITAFAVAVVLTMLSAHRFSPTQIWKDDHGIGQNP